jgi:hypothetical protein
MDKQEEKKILYTFGGDLQYKAALIYERVLSQI